MTTGLSLISGAFNSGDTIPRRYTCEGSNVSPPLRWDNAPGDTRTFALIVDDPDAPTKTFAHWVLFNLPPDSNVLPENMRIEKHFARSREKPVLGANDFGENRYGGPCPPPGDDPHHYYFRLYALDIVLDLGEGATREQVTSAMREHILENAELMGRFGRE
jgi:Raf kinase inhibitor-like YbhB/YbcL family protein